MGLKVDKQRPHNQVIHGVVGVGSIIQILVEIARFGSKVFIESPAEACKRTVLIEAGLAACGRRIESYKELIPSNQA